MSAVDKPVGFFDDFYRPFGSLFSPGLPARAESWMPAVDIRKADGAYHIEMEVPGFKAEEIEVEAHDQVLTVQGERSEDKTSEEGDYVHRERRFGRFVRRFNLPGGVDSEKINAQVKDGLLQVVIPSSKAEGPQKIAVE